jgi:hypothetical protein
LIVRLLLSVALALLWTISAQSGTKSMHQMSTPNPPLPILGGGGNSTVAGPYTAGDKPFTLATLGSIWNTPVPNGVTTATIPSIGTQTMFIDRWSGGSGLAIYQAHTTDPLVNVLYDPLAFGDVATTGGRCSPSACLPAGNNCTNQALLRHGSGYAFPFGEWNNIPFYASASATVNRVAPSIGFVAAANPALPPLQIYAPAGAAAATNSQGDFHLAVVQPNGMVFASIYTMKLDTACTGYVLALDGARLESTHVALSNSDQTGTYSGTTGFNAPMFGALYHNSGKWNFSAVMTSTTPANWGIGLATVNANSSSNQYLGIDANSLGVYGNSLSTLNNVNGNPGVTFANGDTVDFAADITNKLWWIKSTSSSNWNGSVSNSPATGVGGISYSALASGNVYPAFVIHQTGDVAAVNLTSPTAITGYSPWSNGATITYTGDYVAAYYGLFDGARSYGDGYVNAERASMIPAIAGVIQQRDVDNGVIDHAVSVAANAAFMVAQTPPSYPAYTQDNQVSNPPAYGGTSPTLPMGSRLVLPASFNVNSPGTHNSCAANSWCDPTFGLIFAKVFQNYGGIIVERDGTSFELFVEAGVNNSLYTTSTTARQNDLNYILSQLQYVTTKYSNPH